MRTPTNRNGLPWLLLALCAVPAAGCAFTNITLQAPPHATVTHKEIRARGGAREVVLTEPFVDKRPMITRCGMKKNAYNIDTADIFCASPPNVWLAQLLREELLAAGFRVTPPGQPASPTAIRIDGELRQFFLEPKVGFFTFTPEADIEILLRAASEAGLVAERRFYFKGQEVSLVGTEDNYRLSMESAVRQALAKLVDAISQLLDQYQRVARTMPKRIFTDGVSRAGRVER